MINLQKIKKTLLFTLAVLAAVLHFTSCQTEYEYDGDILAAVNEDLSSVISFKKDAESPVAFTRKYKIGQDYSSNQLPGNDTPEVSNFNQGFDITGWKLDESAAELQKYFTFDEDGYVTSFHMGIKAITLYAAGYTASSDTPYKIIYKTQNLAMDAYEYYDEAEMTGTTSTPDNPSYTDAANNLIEIPGFTALASSIVEQEILADGSTVVEVLYNRNAYTLTFHSNEGGGTSEALDTQTFYYGVPAALKTNGFTRSGYSFAGWATGRTGSVAFANQALYTIDAADADLYAVWTLPNISITISLPGADEVGISWAPDTVAPNKIILSAVIPDGHADTEYTYKWYNSNTVPATQISGAVYSSYIVDTTGFAAGYYQYTLIAELGGVPAGGGTVQIQVGD